MKKTYLALALTGALVLGACTKTPPPEPPPPPPPPPGAISGSVAADTNGDGCLGPAEVRAENDRRLARDGAEASPLVDWNLDGCVDQKEFGNTVHSYFDLADKTKDGRVSQIELRGPSMPIAPRTGAPTRTGMDSAGSTTQTPTNPATGLPY